MTDLVRHTTHHDEHQALWQAIATVARTRTATRLDHHGPAYSDLVASIAVLEEYLASHPLDRGDATTIRHLTLALCGVSAALEQLRLYEHSVAWTDRLADLLARGGPTQLEVTNTTRRGEALWERGCSEHVRGNTVSASEEFAAAREAYMTAATKMSDLTATSTRTQELAAIACACDVMVGRVHADSRTLLDAAIELQRRAPHGHGRQLRLAATVLARHEGRVDDAVAVVTSAAERVDSDALAATDLAILIEHASLTEPATADHDSPAGVLVRRLVADWHRRADSAREAYDEQLAEARAELRAADHSRHPLVDPLTGVGNRQAIDAALAQQLERSGEWFCVAHVDIDQLASINERDGHLAGDAALRYVADTLAACGPDDIVARVGADEFVVLMPRTTPADARARLAPLTRLPAAATGLAAGVGVSLTIGIAQAQPSSSASDVLAAADLAMIDAKRTGTARIVVVE